MQPDSPQNAPELSSLGKPTAYISQYDASLLFPIQRAQKRIEIGIQATLPFFGVDIWNAYEVSWLNSRGKPQIAIATFIFPADSPNLIESKSLKLYLNSFNQTKLTDVDTFTALLQHDLSVSCGASVKVKLMLPEEFEQLRFQELSGVSLDRLNVEIAHYQPDASLLHCNQHEAPIEEKLMSNLLKSNCLVTGQPDWASVQIHYLGAPIEHEGLLKYLIGFRDHNEFHEQCVERIFVDIFNHCKPQKLAVYARYTRRGGLDINPWRSNFSSNQFPSNFRTSRQ